MVLLDAHGIANLAGDLILKVLCKVLIYTGRRGALYERSMRNEYLRKRAVRSGQLAMGIGARSRARPVERARMSMALLE